MKMKNIQIETIKIILNSRVKTIIEQAKDDDLKKNKRRKRVRVRKRRVGKTDTWRNEESDMKERGERERERGI